VARACAIKVLPRMKFTIGNPNPRFAKLVSVIVKVAGGLTRSIVLGSMPLTPATMLKVAVTACAALTVTVQVPVPAQLPLQPVKVEPGAGAAVRMTTVPVVNDAAHVEPQAMPPRLLVTVPLPAPVLDTVRVAPFETPVPVTSRDNVSPLAVKLTLVLAAAALVGANRTVTVAVAPVPTRVKGLPDTIEKGAGTDAVPVVVPERVLWTVKVWVAELPIGTLPKLTVPVGVAAIRTCATALAAGEQGLSLPPMSTAVIATL
jgi:hypothetical protein